MSPQQPLLILDLDETLIYGTRQALTRQADLRIEEFHIYRRPRLAEFLTTVSLAYRLAVWTAATRNYAEPVVASFFPAPAALEFVWCREQCKWRRNLDTHEEYWLKDLVKLRRRNHDLNRTLFVDDNKRGLERNYGNHVAVAAYAGEPEDDELPRLARYLLRIAAFADLRALEKRGWHHNAAA